MSTIYFPGMPRLARRLVGLLILAVFTGPTGNIFAADKTLVAAASSLRTLWPDLIDQYGKDTGEARPRVSFASSGLLTSQIRNGAPFELFLSADTSHVKLLQGANLTREKSRVFATGTLLLVAHVTSGYTDDLTLSGVAARISQLQVDDKQNRAAPFKITFPNPVHAPYGEAAKTALISAAGWPVPAGYLLAAENAAQALQFVNSGAVDIGIVPRALLTGIKHTLKTSTVPADAYDPVAHTMTLLRHPSDAADRLFNWLQTDSAKSILKRHGLNKPAGIAENQ